MERALGVEGHETVPTARFRYLYVRANPSGYPEWVKNWVNTIEG